MIYLHDFDIIKPIESNRGEKELFSNDGTDYISHLPSPRMVTLHITSFIGTCAEAEHFYGSLSFSDLSFKKVGDIGNHTVSFGGYTASELPKNVEGIKLELTRELSQKEIDYVNDFGEQRFAGYSAGSTTTCFNTKEDVLCKAILEYFRIFQGYGWALTIDDDTE